MDFEKIALKYAAAGLHVLPLVPGQKNPACKNGVHDATTDTETISMWAKRWPRANIGIHPGPAGYLILDWDTKGPDGKRGTHPNGLDTLDDLKPFHPGLEDGKWIVATPTGGFHYYFTAPEGFDIGSPVDVLRGLDLRHNGTFCVAPPSVHPEGGTYRWLKREGDSPPVLPPALAELLSTAKSQTKRAERADFGDEDEPIHARHAVLIKIGGSLRARGLDKSAIKAALMDINERRCAPEPLSEKEIDRIVNSNMKLTPSIDYAKEEAKKRLGIEDDKVAGKKLPQLRTASGIRPVAVRWLMPGYFAIGKYNLLWGMEGRGKSYLTIGMAAAVSNGLPLPGQTELESAATGPGSVVFLAYEDDPADTIIPRLIKCGADLDKVFVMHHEDNTITSKDIEGLTAKLESIPDLRMVVIDPLTSYAAGISDISETDIRTVVDPLIRLAAGKDFAIIGVKHANKRSDVSVFDRTAGGRAWTGAARVAVLAGHDNEAENEQHHTYGGFLATKGNLSGVFRPQRYEIHDGVFEFTGDDPGLTADRLFPKKEKKEKD